MDKNLSYLKGYLAGYKEMSALILGELEEIERQEENKLKKFLYMKPRR